MAILFTFRVFARTLLRGSHRMKYRFHILFVLSLIIQLTRLRRFHIFNQNIFCVKNKFLATLPQISILNYKKKKGNTDAIRSVRQ